MNDELKPCPFCGSDAVLAWEGERANCGNPKCKLQEVVFTPEAWNTRPPVEAQAMGSVFDGPPLNLGKVLQPGKSDDLLGEMLDDQPTPPAAETREAGLRERLATLVKDCFCPNGELRSSLLARLADILDEFFLPHHEPQAPRVSEEAREIARRLREMRDEQEWPLTSTVARTWFNRAAALLEEYAAAPQAPRVSEGASAAIEAFRRFLSSAKPIRGGAHGQQVGQESYRLDYTGKDEAEVMDALAALSQPAQGEGKTEAEDELIDTVVDLAPTGLNCRAVAKAIAAVVAERANGREQSPT